MNRRKNAPIGPRPAHRVFTESPAFKRWFGKSVLVREDGDPLVLLHGTSEDFTVFEKLGTTSLRPLGFWFADDPDDAEAFGDRLMPVYLRVENPYYANLGKMQEAAFGDKSWARRFREELITKGHDGIIVRPKTEQVGRFTVRDPMLVCVFDPRQVKSAIGNRGTFDKSSPDITRNPTGRGGIGRRARLKIEFPHRSASSSLAAPTKRNPPIDLKPFHVEPEKTTRRRARGVFDDYQYDDEMSAARQRVVQQVLDRNGLSAGRLLGTGSFASVYELKGHPERVVKVTNDPTDAAVMAEAMHAPHVQGLPRVYEVHQTPAKSYVVVMERLFPLSPGEKADVSNIVSEYERGWSIAQGWVPRTKTTSGFEKAFVEALTYLRRLGFYFSDLHANNVMKREDGSYVISDLGMASVAVNKRGSRDVPLINPALRDTGTLAAVAVRDDEMVHITLYDTESTHDLMASLVGYAMVSEDGPGGTLISWQAAAQRGYGPMLYSLAAAVTGKPLHPSHTRSQAALAFWAKQPGGVVPVLSEGEFEKKFGVTTLELLRRANLSPREIRALQALGSSTAVDASYLEERGERSELPRDELMRLRATRPTPLRSRPSEEKLTKLASRLSKKSRPSRANPLVGFRRYDFERGSRPTRHEAVFRSSSYERTWEEAVRSSPIKFRVYVVGRFPEMREFVENIFDIDAHAKDNNEVVIVTGLAAGYTPESTAREGERGTPTRVSRPSPFMILHNLAEQVGFLRAIGKNYTNAMEFDKVDTWAGRNGALQADDQAQADLFAKYVMTGRFAYSGKHAKEALEVVTATYRYLEENPGIYFLGNTAGETDLPLGDDMMDFLQQNFEAFEKKGKRSNPADLKGRSIPDRYLAGLPPAVQKARVRELTRSRDAYRKGDYSELPSDRIARQMGLVKKSAYSEVAEARGIEWQGDEADMARRVCAHYKVKCTPAVATAIRSSFNKGLAAWKSGGHRPGATAQNWAVARVASLVVGGKTSLTADRKEFASFPAPLQKAIAAGRSEVIQALRAQGREDDARRVSGR